MVYFRLRGPRAAILMALAATMASASVASRVNGSAAPAASAVLAATPRPAGDATDESSSLRQGMVTALDERGKRVQVQGIWLDVAGGKTQLSRHGQPAPIDSLRVGEAIRFTVAPGSAEAPSLRVIYAP